MNYLDSLPPSISPLPRSTLPHTPHTYLSLFCVPLRKWYYLKTPLGYNVKRCNWPVQTGGTDEWVICLVKSWQKSQAAGKDWKFFFFLLYVKQKISRYFSCHIPQWLWASGKPRQLRTSEGSTGKGRRGSFATSSKCPPNTYLWNVTPARLNSCFYTAAQIWWRVHRY